MVCLTEHVSVVFLLSGELIKCFLLSDRIKCLMLVNKEPETKPHMIRKSLG